MSGWRIMLVLWMTLIFLASSGYLSPWMSADGTVEVFGFLNYIVRKLTHFGEFAILTYLWLRSIWTEPDRLKACLGWSMVFSVLYAVSDEVHQCYVPQRQGIWTDVIFDAAGALAAGWALGWVGRRERGGLRRRVLGPQSLQIGAVDKI